MPEEDHKSITETYLLHNQCNSISENKDSFSFMCKNNHYNTISKEELWYLVSRDIKDSCRRCEKKVMEEFIDTLKKDFNNLTKPNDLSLENRSIILRNNIIKLKKYYMEKNEDGTKYIAEEQPLVYNKKCIIM